MSSSPYSQAGRLLNQIWIEQKGGLKNVAYNYKGELTCSKATYAQCCKVLRYKSLLDKILLEEPIKAKNQGLLYVLLYELLLGPNLSIRGGGALKRALVSRKDKLVKILNHLQESIKEYNNDEFKKDNNNNNLQQLQLPRYVRINTLYATTSNVIKNLLINHQQVFNQSNIYIDRHIPDLLVLPPTPETRAALQDHVTSNEVILQDKSSCFSAFCLVYGYGTFNDGEYLDACAAPGNKTSHLAALIDQYKQQQQQQQQNKQQLAEATTSRNNIQSNKNKKIQRNKKITTVHALDRSPQRYKSLKRRMEELVPSSASSASSSSSSSSSLLSSSSLVNVKSHCTDFLTTTQSDFPNVTNILLDPSCSGSGMASHRIDQQQQQQHGNSSSNSSSSTDPPKSEKQRVQSLSNFQLLALKHAMTKFPNVSRIVYSTCSLYIQENENVVARALMECSDDDEWELISPICLKTWKRRGINNNNEEEEEEKNDIDNDEVDEEANSSNNEERDDNVQNIQKYLTKEQSKTLIRVDPIQDYTNGFFVACFQRRSIKSSSSSSSPTTTTKAMKIWQGISDPPKNIKIYNGEQLLTTTKTTTTTTNNDDDDKKKQSKEIVVNSLNLKNNNNNNNNMTTNSNNDKSKKQSNNKQKRKNHHHPTTTTDNADTVVVGSKTTTTTTTTVKPILSKKQAKKRAWKQRQAERKRQRLEKQEQQQQKQKN